MVRIKTRLSRNLENPKVEAILDLLKAGALLTGAFLFPGAIKELKTLLVKKEEFQPWKKFDQRRLRQEVKRLVKRKLLSIKEINGDSIVTLTENGQREIFKYNLKNLKIEKPEKWDGKWWVVIFDIDERKHSLRDTLRRKMITLGFFSLQKSVFIYPYPCKKEIAFLRQMYNVGDEVSVFKGVELEEEESLRKYFDLG